MHYLRKGSRIFWVVSHKEFDVDEFVARLTSIRDELKKGNIRILSKLNDNFLDIEKFSFLGSPLTDTGLSNEEMFKYKMNEEEKTFCSCMQPANTYNGEPMVDRCSRWFHCECVGFLIAEAKESDD